MTEEQLQELEYYYEQCCRLQDIALAKAAIASEPVDNPHDDLPF